MTNEEYSDLKYKIVARENKYFINQILTSAVLGLIFATIMTFIGNKNIAEMFFIPFVGNMMIAFDRNPWREIKIGLDELFKSKASYEKAEKELGLKYEPPKNGIYVTPTPVYPAFFIIEKVYIFPIVN